MNELGLFPLGIVLLPTEQIPLHIFEERYQELIGECMEEDREFGLVYADEDGLRDIGTRAAVTEVLDRFDDGRLNIVAEGRERFRLVELTAGRTFQTGIVEEIADDPDVADPEDTEHALELYHRLVELTGAEVEEPRLDVVQLSFELAGRFEFAPELKQRLLQLTSERSRMHLLAELLDGRGHRGRARTRDRRARPGQRQGRPQAADTYHDVMAVTADAKLDVQRIRADFPYLEELSNGKPVAFLDSAASTQKPRQVLDAMRDFYEHRVRERAPRRLPARGARDRGLRGRAGEGARASSTRRPRARSSSRAAPPRRSTSSPTPGGSTTSAPATSS